MSVTGPARCLFCSFSRATLARYPRRAFHTTPTLSSTRKPKHANIKASDVSGWLKANASQSGPYSAEEKAEMLKVFSPDQIKAIEAGEKAISDEDIEKQSVTRDDSWALKYIDDFSTVEPVIDHHIRAPVTNTDPNSRLKTEDELTDDLANFVLNLPQDISTADWLRFTDKLRLTVGKEEAETDPHSALVPDVYAEGENFYNVGRYEPLVEKAAINKAAVEVTPALKTLMQVTGYSEDDIKGLRVKTLVSHDVVNQTRLGKIRKAYVLSVAGNGKGLLGIGEGKSEEVDAARLQSQYRAIRNMQPVPRYEERTIYGDVKGKVGGTELVLMHRPPGFGLRCSHRIWEMCRVAGIKDLAARVSRSRNPMNTAKAAYQALMSQKLPEDIARARGKKLVDVRKVYYAGNV